MNIIHIIKDTISLATKIENVSLVNNLKEIQMEMFELLLENQNLKVEIRDLKEQSQLRERIVRHKDAFITLKDDAVGLIYCSSCWDNSSKLIQAKVISDNEHFCPVCGGFSNHALY